MFFLRPPSESCSASCPGSYLINVRLHAQSATLLARAGVHWLTAAGKEVRQHLLALHDGELSPHSVLSTG
ncbi:hypothetical protein EN860_021630 [Mesorhizobium sp. M00.F.Ca.ET.217.01.1.1]|nr:MAG: hypothetical protein EOS41_23245 [Mesorhizobium sp.]TGQ19073.1 hypothetical protein EN860_021630 [Mesorhizobium sp. M00.F.Ca.ET.217.01.1.1]TGV89961.1 hypothetical protein EN801_019955 [Mesorhizobium sp. M00.F.Ca.ET.158.01.1.1]